MQMKTPIFHDAQRGSARVGMLAGDHIIPKSIAMELSVTMTGYEIWPACTVYLNPLPSRRATTPDTQAPT